MKLMNYASVIDATDYLIPYKGRYFNLLIKNGVHSTIIVTVMYKHYVGDL